MIAFANIAMSSKEERSQPAPLKSFKSKNTVELPEISHVIWKLYWRKSVLGLRSTSRQSPSLFLDVDPGPRELGLENSTGCVRCTLSDGAKSLLGLRSILSGL